jgi:rubrerythrin
MLSKSKNLTLAQNDVKITSALNAESEKQLSALAEELCGGVAVTLPEEAAAGGKKYVCKICGYIHEGELCEDFTCPLCKKPKEFFEEIK